MILGADPATAAAINQALGPPPPPITGAVMGFILPGAIVTLVRRESHPFIWWAFGVIPLAWSAGRLVLAVGSKVEKK